jgi:hypothetical protein
VEPRPRRVPVRQASPGQPCGAVREEKHSHHANMAAVACAALRALCADVAGGVRHAHKAW